MGSSDSSCEIDGKRVVRRCTVYCYENNDVESKAAPLTESLR